MVVVKSPAVYDLAWRMVQKLSRPSTEQHPRESGFPLPVQNPLREKMRASAPAEVVES